jgi:hypothetical protein
MAIIEEVPDSPEPSPVRSPEVEVVPEAGIAPASAPAPPSPPPETSDPRELARVLHTLSARLALPEDLLPSFLSEENGEL